MPPTFSVILATRDRPGLFAEALQSVMDQDYPAFNVIVVNDGSSEAALEGYQAVWNAAAHTLGSRFSVHHLVHRPKGHGQSYSLNFGVANATTDYVCFLDDDDKWTDPAHLSRAAQAISHMAERGKTVDLYMANQHAWTNDKKVPGPVWLEGLEADLTRHGQQANADGCYEVGISNLMAATGFCHLNCFTVRRALWDQVGGMDEGIRWECDRDIFLRLVDNSQTMLHHPGVMSFHRVPDPSKALNMTTTLGMIEKRLLQVRVLDKAALFSKHRLIRAHARKHKAYALKKIAQELAEKRNWTDAKHYAAQALGAAPGFRWLAFTLYCFARSLGHRESNA